jgi:hypothetical protein
VRLDRPTRLWEAVPMIKTSRIIVAVFASVCSPLSASAAGGSAGTGDIWTGIGPPPAGPGIYGGGRTQQPGLATNPSRGSMHLLSPAEKNARVTGPPSEMGGKQSTQG